MNISIMNLHWSIQIQLLQCKGSVIYELKLDCDYILSTAPINTKEISRFVSPAITKGQREAVKLIRCRLYRGKKKSIPMYFIRRYMEFVCRAGFFKIHFSSIFNAF